MQVLWVDVENNRDCAGVYCGHQGPARQCIDRRWASEVTIVCLSKVWSVLGYPKY